jgi:hypothetical protein
MTLKKPLSILCYVYSENQRQLLDLGVSSSDDLETNEVTFYSIDNISSDKVNGVDGEVGWILSGGRDFATILTYEHLKDVINECRES